jgi:hypothetical protein
MLLVGHFDEDDRRSLMVLNKVEITGYSGKKYFRGVVGMTVYWTRFIKE